MKKILTTFVLLCLCTCFVHAQVKVHPIGNTTTITHRLAEGVTSAKICIYNLAGKQLQCHELPATQGANTIEVRASSLQAGMYLYSLIVENQLLNTKRMVLTE